MNEFVEKWSESAFRRVRDVFFHPETGLVYDYITSFDHGRRFSCLPSPTEIAAAFPNPCGWGTGMEDCALNGGFLLDLLRLRGEGASPFACRTAAGLIGCGTVHGVPGFLARGVSPFDGRSCYGNSSRDQFTLATYGLWRFLGCRGIPEQLRQQAAELLGATADYCERMITPVSGCSLRRLDGGAALVSSMWRWDPHEAMRLPMIYGIAALATGKRHYHELLRRYAEPGLRHTLKMDPAGDYWDMPVIQMQLSLNFFRESGILPELSGGVQQAMLVAAGLAARKLPLLVDELERFTGAWDTLYDNWRLLPMRLTPGSLSPDGSSALFDGKSYLNPVFRRAYAYPNALLRGIGNYLGVISHCPGFALPEELLARIDRRLADIDLSRCTGIGILPLLHGRASLRQKQLQGEIV